MDLGMMTGKGALRLAKQESGLTQSEIADRLGVSHAVTKRYFNVNDKYMPSLEMIPRLCSVLGNDILMRWRRPGSGEGNPFAGRKSRRPCRAPGMRLRASVLWWKRTDRLPCGMCSMPLNN